MPHTYLLTYSSITHITFQDPKITINNIRLAKNSTFITAIDEYQLTHGVSNFIIITALQPQQYGH
ncbi:hypothetical protein BMR1_02g02130 [Babesia microti strain RI]|uniref:Uncharacterized protein n=1 Tax=Babesia microti (strain RI) TaxID=1133968 RepID=I7JA34_BABMR|nr:hypothetical protein BMR1_02g02130 [Babesia microti strain RI]CCF73584.1 hypothetical protein BMR1_02g02130 [Babesia microti strain RI]|eukprot:XP_012648193.1 hypothetical protein BMR1_02g02130 [Babesia microti strain RI]